jgi:hypothetical protein
MEIVKQIVCGNWSLISILNLAICVNLTGELMSKHHQCAHGPKHSSCPEPVVKLLVPYVITGIKMRKKASRLPGMVFEVPIFSSFTGNHQVSRRCSGIHDPHAALFTIFR